MPIRPTVGGFQAPQWLMETIRHIENNVRRLEEAINALKRGETLSPSPQVKDVPTADSSGGGGTGGSWNGGIGVSVNSLPASANAKLLNFKSGTGVSLGKSVNNITGQVDVTMTNSAPFPELIAQADSLGRGPFNSLTIESAGNCEITHSGTASNPHISIDAVSVPREIYMDGVMFGSGSSTDHVNFIGGAGIDITPTYSNGEIGVTISASPLPQMVNTNVLVHTATSNFTVPADTYAEATNMTVTIPGVYSPNPGYRWFKFSMTAIIANWSDQNNRHVYLKPAVHTDTFPYDNTTYVNYVWTGGHSESHYYIQSVTGNLEQNITGIPAGTGTFPFAGTPSYTPVLIEGTAQYNTLHDTTIKLYAYTDAGVTLHIATGSNIVITPLT